ncbi:MAG TPA: phosphoenolpyruvate synthase [Kofleriaceae bacterium]|nr:phosphoenolpyruvate synthase [Kofleriaceae bacterium]
MKRTVIDLREIDRTMIDLVGGKAANLGELTRISGIRVPDGFCVTTEAFGRTDLAEEIRRAVAEDRAYAVRSSATAEDLPTASFAGQYESYLDVVGADAIVEHVERCWASLATPRAVAYRAQHGIHDDRVRLAVVVQEMVPAAAAGVLFTADPTSGHRKVSSIDATLGLGDALVSGRVNPDVYRVRDGTIVDRKVVSRVLTDAQIVELERIGRTIEAHFGRPQDIEWCFADGCFSIVQSRPITTLFPIPVRGDDDPHVYVSVGHQQMMTDAMKPLGRSLFQLVAMAPMFDAGGRLFVDVAKGLSSPGRQNLLDVLGAGDPLIGDALVTLLDRGDFLPATTAGATPPMIRSHKGLSAAEIAAPVANDPEIVASLIDERERSLAALKTEIERVRGAALFAFLVEDIARSKQLLADPRSRAAIMAGIHAPAWIDEHVEAWLGEKKVADTIARSLPPNITSEMGLALFDIADVYRRDPAEAQGAIDAFLARYGMRCTGEIDLTRERWAEQPSALVPLILGVIKTHAPGEGRRIAEARRQAALDAEREILARLRASADGETKAADTALMIDVIRRCMGYREYPKYHLICRFFAYKQALLREADELVRANAIDQRDDLYFLTFQELHAGQIDRARIAARRDEHRAFERLTPPRVMTSDGEILTGAYKRAGLPAGALVGLAVSSGVIEGRARIVSRLDAAELDDGDILVTTFTDPSWTPLFVSIKGLVTEVGGLMTHGAVIAREYALPAVVGVERATERIRDGQRIRVNGTDGYVELL